MEIAEAGEFYEAIRRSQWTSLVDDLVGAAVKYARIRTDWALSSADERREMDEARSRAHTAFIDCCNILSRSMVKSGEDNSWRSRLGNDKKRSATSLASFIAISVFWHGEGRI